jgi:tRNA pseudouridine38-40 synthase
MRTFKLVLEYDGTAFHGWQVQPYLRTVQGELARALDEVTGERSRVTGAGRTDTGVHAVGQVASFSSATRLGPLVLARALNARLPFDVRVRSVEEAPAHFNARFDAKSRTYSYIFIRRETALWRSYYHFVKSALDIPAMRLALREARGERDFSAFASSQDDSPSKRCRVTNVELLETPPLLTLSITADRFLHHMVRSLAGTVLEIGRGKPWRMEEIIASRDPAKAGATLPPHALYLMRVGY